MINMFQNATFKLTLVYMGILTVICIFFSYNWYTIATEELDRGLDRQSVALKARPRFAEDMEIIDEILEEAGEKYEDAKKVVLNRVIATNIIIIGSGTLGAFLLARRTLDPIERAHQEQIRFTADASHELRTPIAAMQTEIEVALRDKKITKQEAVDQLKSNIEELSKLTALSEGLLKLARQDESVGIELAKMSLDATVEKAVERVAMQAKHKKIKLVREKSDASVIGDFDSIVDMLAILLDNAIKYSPDESPVSVSVSATKTYVTVSVKDSGAGIRKSELEHIFDRFYRADSSRSSQNAKGHGLGLSIAKSISDIHEANLHAESAGPGTGATFMFRLRRS